MSTVNAASYLSDCLNRGNLEAIATRVVDPMQSVRDLLQGGQGLVDSQLHFILEIRPPKRRREEEEEDSGNHLLSSTLDISRLLPLTQINQGYKMTILANRESPSSNSRPSNYIKNQAGDTAILDGRYDPANSTPTAAPPIQLYHPVFAEFLGAMSDTSDLPEDLVVETGELMRSASGIAVLESSRATHISNILGASHLQSVNLNKTAIFHARTSPPDQTALLATVEGKSELGSEGDVTIQGGCSYTTFWLSKDVSIRSRPSFLVS